MQPLRIRIERIIDFAKVVSLVGTDVQTGMPVTIHVDHRPFAGVRKALRDAGLPRPIEYEADGVMLHLDLLPVDDVGAAQLVELDGSDAAGSGCAAVRLVQELDR